MTINPIAFDEDTQTDTMQHSDKDHTFELPLSEINYVVLPDGSSTWESFLLICPIDGHSVMHPVAGGAAPVDVQIMSSRLIGDKGCPCGTVLTGEPNEVSLAHAKLHCVQIDFPERWQIPINLGPICSILVNDTSSYIVGVGPFETVPSGYSERSLLARSAGAEDLEKIINNTYTKYSGNHQIVVAEKPNAASSD